MDGCSPQRWPIWGDPQHMLGWFISWKIHETPIDKRLTSEVSPVSPFQETIDDTLRTCAVRKHWDPGDRRDHLARAPRCERLPEAGTVDEHFRISQGLVPSGKLT